jgi:hypothetical protein
MTRSHEKGENEFTREAKREALRTGRSADEILTEWLADAKRDRDKERQAKVIQALKFLRGRNRRRRRGR